MAGVKIFLLKPEIHIITEVMMLTHTCIITTHFMFDTFQTHTPTFSTLHLLKVKNNHKEEQGSI
jgi:hypothetical protein